MAVPFSIILFLFANFTFLPLFFSSISISPTLTPSIPNPPSSPPMAALNPFFSLLLIFSIFFSLSASQPPTSYLIDCGATVSRVISGRKWLPDGDFIAAGAPKNLSLSVLDPTLSTVRTFPVGNNSFRKFCYVVPVYRGRKYMIRTTYFYGGVNGNANLNPPVFDQIVAGTTWAVVNTTEDYLNGMSTYYEGVFPAAGKTMSVCLGANKYTDSDPFISALEVVLLPESVYNSTDFSKYGFSLIARHSFGHTGPIIRYPADQFDRFWAPFGDHSPALNSTKVSVSGIWNQPPIDVFQTGLIASESEPMELLWPPYPLPNAIYYVALYFANDRDSPSGRRAFDISLNGVVFYHNLSVTAAGVMVFADQWPLSGITNVTLTRAPGSIVAPVINAGEVFRVLPLGGKTHTRDVIALEKLKAGFENPPLDWNGDPCLPPQYSWTGVVCSGGTKIRVTTLNLTGMGLSGMLSSSIANLTALTGIWLGNNDLSGSIPDLSSLKRLEILHLEDNQIGGEIAPSLGSIKSLRELFLQNNNLTGQIPGSILGKPGINLRTTPGNPFLSGPPA